MIPKFRGYSEALGYFVEGSFLYTPEATSDFNIMNWIVRKDGFKYAIEKPSSIGQSTGLKDKNGVEVYFNDIVEDEYRLRYEVVFEGDCLRCNGIRRIRGGHKPKNRWFSKDLEIIGNRYENPELLEEQEWNN